MHEIFFHEFIISIIADLDIVLKFLHRGLIHSEVNLNIFLFYCGCYYFLYFLFGYQNSIVDFYKLILNLTTLLKIFCYFFIFESIYALILFILIYWFCLFFILMFTFFYLSIDCVNFSMLIITHSANQFFSPSIVMPGLFI